MPSTPLLIYGANGYTGALIARLAVARGWRPILAGRSRAALAAVAAPLGLEERVFALEDAAALDAGLADAQLVLHCAGPFAHTVRQMIDACFRTRTHYLDMTGEVAVVEALCVRDAEAPAAGIKEDAQLADELNAPYRFNPSSFDDFSAAVKAVVRGMVAHGQN